MVTTKQKTTADIQMKKKESKLSTTKKKKKSPITKVGKRGQKKQRSYKILIKQITKW